MASGTKSKWTLDTTTGVLLAVGTVGAALVVKEVVRFGGIMPAIRSIVAFDLSRPGSGMTGSLTLHLMQRMNAPVRAVVRTSLFEALGPGVDRKVLELGCANGEGLVEMLDEEGCKDVGIHGSSFVGVDISERALTEAGERPELKDAQFLLGAVGCRKPAQLPLADASMDAVFHTNCIYFWEDVDAGIADIFRVLRSDGVLVFSTAPEDLLKEMQDVNPAFRNVSFGSLADQLSRAGFVSVSVSDASDATPPGTRIWMAKKP